MVYCQNYEIKEYDFKLALLHIFVCTTFKSFIHSHVELHNFKKVPRPNCNCDMINGIRGIDYLSSLFSFSLKIILKLVAM